MKILIIKPGAIGDLLQMTPVFRALKEKFPGCLITLMTGSAVTASLFRHLPTVDEVIIFDRKGAHRAWSSFLALWRQIRRHRFDIVLNFQRSNLKAWLLVTAAIPARILVYHKARGRMVHAVQNHLETLAPLGIDAASADQGLEMPVGEEAEAFAEQLFSSCGLTGSLVVALNPGASHAVNRWDVASFTRLADRLAEELSVKVVIVGGNDDIPLAEEIAGSTAYPVLNLTGRTTLLQLGAVLKRCSIMVSADTGPMHVATAVGTRVVALFGAADPARTGPVGADHRVIQATGLSCVPCRSRRCDSSSFRACMERITVEDVFAVIASMIGRD